MVDILTKAQSKMKSLLQREDGDGREPLPLEERVVFRGRGSCNTDVAETGQQYRKQQRRDEGQQPRHHQRNK